MTKAEIIALATVILTTIGSIAAYIAYREKMIKKRTQQEDKLDGIAKSVNEIRDDVKTLNGLKTLIDNLDTEVKQAQRTADKAHERIDSLLGVERGAKI